MGLVQSAAAYGVGKIMDKLYDDPETNMRKMMDLADKIAGGKIQVRYELADLAKTGYAPKTGLRLSGEKLRALGWKPTKNLEDMFRDLLQAL